MWRSVMHFLIAPDSFKESLSALEVAKAIRNGLQASLPKATFDLMPVADGGEGTALALAQNKRMTLKRVKLEHAYSQSKEVSYALDHEMAVFDMAAICGLELIPENERHSLMVSTEGVGEMIRFLVNEGVKKILIGVGGSATNDGGIGMAKALGYDFKDESSRSVEALAKNLSVIKTIQSDNRLDLSGVSIVVLADVTNPLCGPDGAAYTYGPQKGLTAFEIEQVDRDLEQFYEAHFPDLLGQISLGAGGGMAAGLRAFAGATVTSGISYLLDTIDFDWRASVADLVIVGEGRLDRQSLSGKAPIGVAKRVPNGKKVIAICGSVSDDISGFPINGIHAAFPIIPNIPDSNAALFKKTSVNLERTGAAIGQLLL